MLAGAAHADDPTLLDAAQLRYDPDWCDIAVTMTPRHEAQTEFYPSNT